MKVLIVDGSLVIVERLMDMLTDLPTLEVFCHTTEAPAALRSMRSLRPHLVVLDPHFAGRKSMEWLAEIRRECPSAVIAAVTNCAVAPYRRKCVAAGADLFFDKSNEFAQLVDAIRHLVTTREGGQQPGNSEPA